MSRDLKQKLQTGEIELPPIPRAQQEIVDLLQDPNCGMREIGMAIAQDLAFTTKVLRVANSVLYSAGEPILSVPRAAIVMGIEALQEVLQELSELEPGDPPQGAAALELEEVWKHSILTAKLARLIGTACTRCFDISPDELYTCGLLHDLGQIVLLDNLPGVYYPILRESRLRGQDIYVVEEEKLGLNHTKVGALISQRWNLPRELQSAIRYHHKPELAPEGSPAVWIIDIANRVAHQVREGATTEVRSILNAEVAKAIGLSPRHLKAILEKGKELALGIQLV